MDSTSSSHDGIVALTNHQEITDSSPNTAAAVAANEVNPDVTVVSAVDANLSSIVAFNRNYNSDTNGTASPIPNQWGKRPAETSDEDAHSDKRLRFNDENGHHLDPDMSLLEVEVQNQIRAHMEHNPFQNEEDALQDDGDQDQEFEDEEPDEDQLNALASELNNQSYFNAEQNAYQIWDANQTLKIHSLPILDNLSSQILQTLGKGPYTETLNIVTQPDSDQGQAYNTMKSLFDQTKKLYTPEAFLSADELKLETPDQRSTIRKVNLATFVSSVFGSQEVGFFHLNEHFLDTFVPDGGRLLKSQGSLYLDLKTQAYISAMSTNERSKEEILEDLFPANMGEILLSRRGGGKQLTPSEQDFVSRLACRRTHLMQIPDDVNLTDKYAWQEFLKDVSGYVSKNHETIVALTAKKTRKRMSHGGPRPDVMGTPIHHQHAQAMPPMSQDHQQSPTPQSAEDGAVAAVLQAHTTAHNGSPHTPPHGLGQTGGEVLENELFGPNTSYNMGAPPIAQPPVPQQSQPTQVLYERARLAATSKASPNARRSGLPSQRRPWTTEEENALMAGLDRVKGPHWSQILAMFGPGGTVSEALKDRNQVQLKDKARNLKLFFLKSGIEVPYYLQFVTGELKTRAPGQAAKNAAKKAVEASAEEDAAHVAAVTVLGNAHRGDDMSGYHHMSSDEHEGGSSEQGEGSEQGGEDGDEETSMHGGEGAMLLGHTLAHTNGVADNNFGGGVIIEQASQEDLARAAGSESPSPHQHQHQHQFAPQASMAPVAPMAQRGESQQLEDTLVDPLAVGDVDQQLLLVGVGLGQEAGGIHP